MVMLLSKRKSQSLSPIQLFVTPGTVARQVPMTMGILQGIFPSQGSNQGLLYCRQILHILSHQESTPFKNIIEYLIPTFQNTTLIVFLHFEERILKCLYSTHQKPLMRKKIYSSNLAATILIFKATVTVLKNKNTGLQHYHCLPSITRIFPQLPAPSPPSGC